MSEQAKLIEELREVASDHAHGEGYLAGLLKRGAAAIKALHAEAEALRAENERLKRTVEEGMPRLMQQGYELRTQLEAARAEIEELDALRNRQSELLSQTAIALRGPEPALTRYSHADIPSRVKTVVAELEAARGLLRDIFCTCNLREMPSEHAIRDISNRIEALLTATPAPEVQADQDDGEARHDAVKEIHDIMAAVPCSSLYSLAEAVLDAGYVKSAEQGGRQEAVVHDTLRQRFSEIEDEVARGKHNAMSCFTAMRTAALYIPQPGPDVRGLAAFALELIDGAWEGGSFDGGDIQEAGVRHGVLTVEQRQESCGEHCDCAEYGFPSECYRLTPAIAAHRQAQRQA